MLTEGGLLKLMTWLSPGFPVGGYAYSHGIEFAVEDGMITGADDLAAWIEAALLHGAGRIDADLFRLAWQAVDDDEAAFMGVAERAAALRGTKETALESSAQGRAFVDTLSAVWSGEGFEKWAGLLGQVPAPAYGVAVAAATAAAGIPLDQSLAAFLHAFAANLVSAGVRLVPLGQTDGQRILAALAPTVEAAVAAALARAPEDLGSAAPLIDWASMRHETQYTRLFRS